MRGALIPGTAARFELCLEGIDLALLLTSLGLLLCSLRVTHPKNVLPGFGTAAVLFSGYLAWEWLAAPASSEHDDHHGESEHH